MVSHPREYLINTILPPYVGAAGDSSMLADGALDSGMPVGGALD